MDSLAKVLRRIPLFANLPPGGLAKIIADLREERYLQGTAICYEGDAASDFYIVKSGEVAVLVNRGGNEREVVAVNGASTWFGERALFSESSRSATVIARTDVALWRLTKEKFDDLIEENPWLILHFTQELSDRLYSRNQDFSKIQAAFSFQTEFLFYAQPPDHQQLLLQTAILSRLEPSVAQALTGRDDAEAVIHSLAVKSALVARHDGVFICPEAVRDFLLTRLTTQIGAAGVRALHQRATTSYEKIGQWDDAIDHALAAEEFSVAARLLVENVDTCFQQGQLDILHKWIERFPQKWRTQELAPLIFRLEQTLRPDAPLASTSTPTSTPFSPRLRWGLGAIIGIGAGIGVAFAPPFSGLDVVSMHMLGLLIWAVCFWVFDTLPDYVVGIGLIIGWILFDIVPPDVAVSGFTTSPFFLIIGVLGMTASLQSSGLLFRLALYILRSFPLTYRGQALGLALSGTGITTSIPDTTSGTAIAGPIILALSDSLGYTRRSNGSAGLAMSALLGFGQMSPFFLTGAAENLLAWGLLTESTRLQITWGSWFLAALPVALVTLVVAFMTTMFFFPPEFQPTISRGLIQTQIEALGPLSRAEVINAGVVIGAMVGWITAPYHGVDVAWVAMSGLALLLATDLLDRTTFRAGINWDFLFYLGAVLSLTSVVRKLSIDAWIISQLTPLLEPMTGNASRFLMVMVLAVFAARFILPSFPLVSLLTVTIVPIAANAGIHAQALLLVICTSVTVWFLPYQSTCYLALYFGTKEKAFSHSQVRPLAWSYGIIYFLAILVTIPYWRWLQLIP